MIVLIIIAASLVLLMLALAVFIVVRYVPIIAQIAVNVTVRRGREPQDCIEGETVTFETSDGVRLTGTLGPDPEGVTDAPVVVFCHEVFSTRHSVTRYAWFLRERGLRVFAFDFRGHGDSPAPAGYAPRQWVTEGEVFDLRAALRALRARPDLAGRRIALFGVSRGGVTALLAAAADPAIACVAADGVFSTMRTIDAYIQRWASIFVPSAFALRMTPAGVFRFYRRLAVALAQHRLGVRFVELAPELKRLKAPVFLVHGGRDSYLDVAHAEFIRASCASPAELWVVSEADHNETVALEPEEYARRVGGFLAEHCAAAARRATADVR